MPCNLQEIFNTDINNEHRLRIKLNDNFESINYCNDYFSKNFLPLSGGTVTGLTTFNAGVSAVTISAGTIYSGSTDLYDIFGSGGGGSGDITRVQGGINTFTGGTDNYPEVNVTGLSIDNITVSGDSSFNELSATTIYSGNTNLEDIIISLAGSGATGDITRVQGGINTFTGGTDNYPTVNITGGTFDTLNVSGATSLNILSATTIYSGGTNLENVIISLVGSGATGDITRVQSGVNTFTGGTDNFPTVNITGGTFDNIYVSGDSVFNTLSAITISATTFYSGGTNLEEIISNLINFEISGCASTTISSWLPFSGDPTLYYADFNHNLDTYDVDVTAYDFFTKKDIFLDDIQRISVDDVRLYISDSGCTIRTLVQKCGSTVTSGELTRVQPGNNIYTGGTANKPIVGLIDDPIVNSINASGQSVFNALSATTITAATFYSGTTDLYDIIKDAIPEITGCTATTLSTWFPFSADTSFYYADFKHNLGSLDVDITAYDLTNNRDIIPGDIERLNNESIRVFVGDSGCTIRTIVQKCGSSNVIVSGGSFGDVIAPASSINNSLSRFNGTSGKVIKGSNVLLNDSNDLSGINSIDSSLFLSGGTDLETIINSLTKKEREYQFEYLNEITGATAPFYKFTNDSGITTTSSVNVFSGGSINPFIIPKDSNLKNISITIANASVDNASVGLSPTLRINIYKHLYSSRTLLETANIVLSDTSGIGVNNDLTGNAFQSANLDISGSISSGDLIGIEFENQSGSGVGINGIKICMAVITTVDI